MSGLYNALFGINLNGTQLLQVIGLDSGDIYRFRDCYLTEEGEIAVYTRGGGGNRECYCHDYTTEEERTATLGTSKHDPGCVRILQSKMRSNPNYLYDQDDDFDCTYATFYFKVPDEAKAALKGVEASAPPAEKWDALLAALKR